MVHTLAQWWQTPGAGPLETVCAIGGYALAVAGVLGTLVVLDRKAGR